MIPQQGNLFSEGGMCVGVNIRGRWASNEYLVRMNTGQRRNPLIELP